MALPASCPQRVVEGPQRRSKISLLPPVLVAIVGGSGAGKTWLARRLEAALAPQVALLSLDDFYRDLSHLSFAQRERVNFDHPRAIDWRCLERVLRDLLASRVTRIPRYDFSTHCRRPESIEWQPKPVVVIEGLWLLRRSTVRRLFARRLYIECPAGSRLKRRVRRDMAERGRSRASVEQQFREEVAPMHDRYVAPQARWADVILNSPISLKVVARLADELRAPASEHPERGSPPT